MSTPGQISRRLVVSCLSVLWLVSCAGAPVKTPPRTNILMATQQGTPLDPDPAGFKPLKPQDYDTYIDAIFRDLSAFCAQEKAKPERKGKPCELLFFFHGGLNSAQSSVERAAKLQSRIRGDHYYPIFVNWDSSLPSSWWDHVAHVHKGLWTDKNYVAAFPYFAAVDEVKSVVEAPIAWLAEFRHTFPRIGYGKTNRAALDAYRELVQEFDQSPTGKIAINNLILDEQHLQDNRKSFERRKPTILAWVTAPTKLLAPPLLIQAAGPGAWDVMRRRTVMLFRTEDEFRGKSPEAIKEERATGIPQPGPGGQPAPTLTEGAALARFIHRFQNDFLKQFCDSDENDTTWRYSPVREPAQEKADKPKAHEEARTPKSCEGRLDVTLVGHSMGTIVIDRLLRYAPDFQVKNIVFMAAATTVDDYRDTIDSYLRQSKNKDTQMYHLILHPMAEVAERGKFDLSPRGSLLIWIDNYFTNPSTPLDRTVGRFLNLMPELRFAEESVRNRIHVKVFRFGESVHCWNPQTHGDFSQFPFWKLDYWDPKVDTDKKVSYARMDKICDPDAKEVPVQ